MNKKAVLTKIRGVLSTVSILCLIAAVILLAAFMSKNITEDKKAATAPVDVTHRILFLSSYNPLYFTYESQAKGLEEGLYPRGIEYDVIYMDAKNYDSEEDIQAFHDFLKERLDGRRNYEGVLLGDDNALIFAQTYQEELFKGLPMVYFGINDYSLARSAVKNPYMTGFYEKNYLRDTLNLITSLLPENKKLVALHDESIAGKSDMAIFYEASNIYPHLEFSDINTSKISHDELIVQLDSLPEDASLIYMTSYSDNNGNTYSMLGMTKTVVNHAKVPIFRNYVGGEGYGILGGTALDMEAQSRLAATTLADVLEGKDISTIPLHTDTPSRTAFDHQLMKQYDLDLSLLPEDTIFYNKPETFMERYGRMLPIVSLIVFSLLLLIITANIAVKIGRMANGELQLSRDNLERSQEKLKYRAEYDEFLDVLNRRTAEEYMRVNLKQDQVYSIVMADIDGFKEINESYGHQLADEILKHFAYNLKQLAKKGDWLLARYGGDEFLIVVPDKQLSRDDEVIKSIKGIFSEPYPIGGENITMSASIGISNSDGETSPEQHIINAESAMYETKNRGWDGVFLYDVELKQKAREESRIKAKLSEAFDNDGFYMLYQPQINSQTQKISGFEALVRMKEPGIYPGQFIPIAEKSGWIWRIGRITTKLVIEQLSAWRDAGYELYSVSVNFSSNQLIDTGYIDFVKELLDKYNVPAKYLEIEITEGLFLERTAQAEGLFNRFKDLGIRLLMDDFGTGYSSLGYLTYIPVDVIKLDKSLVDAYLVDGRDAFIRDVIQLVHDLDKEIIIEGVEEEWQFNRLREFNADTIQGYFFSKPIPADEAITFKV